MAIRWVHCAMALLVMASACGPSTLQDYVAQEPLPYAAKCQEKAKDHAHRVAELQYNPPKLLVTRWTKTLSGGKHATLDEQDFIDALVQGEARFVMLNARGGVGKSTFAKAIEAQACGRLPTFTVDLRADVAGHFADNKDAGNLILAAIEHQLRIDGDADRRDAFRAMLKKGSFLLLLDSLDEVPIDVRPKVLEHVQGIRDTFKQTGQMVVFGRPSIYSVDYGIKGLDANVELPELTCGRTRATIDWTTEDDAERAALKQFIKVYALDEQNKKHGQCHLPYMSTYRDIQVVQRLARAFNPKTEMGGLASNLATVHEAIVAERLNKELAFLQWDQPTALAAIDNVVRVHGRDDGEWNLEFTVARCLEAQGAKPGEDKAAADKHRWICEKILQSALFSRVGGVEEWAFSHRHIADLFLARWLDREIKRLGTCDVVTQHAAWIADKRVAGYLMGQPDGRNCLFEVSAAVCVKHGYDRNDVGMYYRGLPVGDARTPIVAAALKKSSTSGNACAHKAISGL